MSKRTVRGWLNVNGLKRVLDSLDIMVSNCLESGGKWPEPELGQMGEAKGKLVPDRKVFMLRHAAAAESGRNNPRVWHVSLSWLHCSLVVVGHTDRVVRSLDLMSLYYCLKANCRRKARRSPVRI